MLGLFSCVKMVVSAVSSALRSCPVRGALLSVPCKWFNKREISRFAVYNCVNRQNALCTYFT